MILITRFNGTKMYLNADMIQSVEGTPDTVITLTNNTKVLVKETTQGVIEKIIDYQRCVHNPHFGLQTGE
jgi:flagellar protein FlbD